MFIQVSASGCFVCKPLQFHAPPESCRCQGHCHGIQSHFWKIQTSKAGLFLWKHGRFKKKTKTRHISLLKCSHSDVVLSKLISISSTKSANTD